MKKILLIMPYGSVGGMERLALYFYDYYKSIGYEVKGLKIIKLKNDIISFGVDELYLSDKDFNEMGKVDRFKFYLKIPFWISKIVKNNEITHTISFGDMANLFSSLSYSKEFKVGSIHALKSAEFMNNSFFNKIFKLSYKTTYKKLNKLVCISNAIKKDLIKNCDYKFVNNLEVIYNPHDIDKIRKMAEEPIQDKFEVDLFNTPVILFIGRLSMQKAPWHLLNSFYKLLQKNEKVKLVFVGDGQENVINYLNKLIDKYDINDKVIFMGRKSNPYKYLNKASILALSSYYEGTPNVIVEAIALNTPIVTTNCTDGIGELMGYDNGDNKSFENINTDVGIITPSVFKGKLEIPIGSEFTVEERKLVEALEFVLKNKKNYNGNNEKLLKKFELSNVANNYLQE